MSESPRIPMLDPRPQVEALWTEFNAAFQEVLKSGQFILGEKGRRFEQEAANYLGVKHAIGLNSGTDALFIALRALGIGPGDEVITTPFTFFATAEAITHVGAMPVFVDVEAGSFNLDPALLDAAITPRTRAIIPVHLFGRPCDLARIRESAARHGLRVVEDCAQAFGAQWGHARVGSLGELGCFSFFPTKNLQAFGDGGMLTTQDDELAALARMLRMHGSRRKYFNEMPGYNSRLDELQAAMLLVKLPFIEIWNRMRREAAGRYQDLLGGVPGIVAPESVEGHVFHQYTIRIPGGRRDRLVADLDRLGVQTMVYYPVPCHRLKLYLESHAAACCPVAESLATEVLSLPIWPEITPEIQKAVVAAIRSSV